MYTVVETPTFSRLAEAHWSEEERFKFVSYIAHNPLSGSVVPGSGGVRKVRWTRPGAGKRGGVRVIYFNQLLDGEIWLLLIYGKNVRENIAPHILRQAREEIENG